jgi:hypothetical protein
MSFNSSLNGVIAVIEDKADLARYFFRDPNSDIKDISGAMSRLYKALNNKIAAYLRELLRISLECQPLPSIVEFPSPDEQKAYESGFYAGVQAVEKVMEIAVYKLEDK